MPTAIHPSAIQSSAISGQTWPTTISNMGQMVQMQPIMQMPQIQPSHSASGVQTWTAQGASLQTVPQQQIVYSQGVQQGGTTFQSVPQPPIVFSQQAGANMQSVPQQQIVYSQGVQHGGIISSTSQPQQYVYAESQPVVTQYTEVVPSSPKAVSMPRPPPTVDAQPAQFTEAPRNHPPPQQQQRVVEVPVEKKVEVRVPVDRVVEKVVQVPVEKRVEVPVERVVFRDAPADPAAGPQLAALRQQLQEMEERCAQLQRDNIRLSAALKHRDAAPAPAHQEEHAAALEKENAHLRNLLKQAWQERTELKQQAEKVVEVPVEKYVEIPVERVVYRDAPPQQQQRMAPPPQPQPVRMVAPAPAPAGERRVVGLGLLLERDVQLDDHSIPQIYILEIVPGFAAYNSGQLQVNDVILAIDGRRVDGLDFESVKKLTTGEEGSCCTLHVRRGDAAFSVTLLRVDAAVDSRNQHAHSRISSRSSSQAGSHSGSQAGSRSGSPGRLRYSAQATLADAAHRLGGAGGGGGGYRPGQYGGGGPVYVSGPGGVDPRGMPAGASLPAAYR